LAKVEVILHNPFKINLNLDKITLKVRIGESYAVEVYENCVILKSDHELKFIIMIRPLDVGRLIIEGIEIDFEKCQLKNSLFVPWDMKQQIIREKRRRRLEKYKQQTNSLTSAMSHNKQNDEEYNEDSEGIEIHVVESIPLLNVFLATTTPHIMLYDGELLNTTIKMQNVGDLVIDFIECEAVNGTRSELHLLSDTNSHCPLMPHEPGIDLPLAIRARWNGNDESAEVILNVKYGNKTKKWYRRISLPLKLTVTQGLVLEQVNAINENFGREIVCKIHNKASVPFVLLSNDDSIVEIETDESIIEQDDDRQNDNKNQFDRGIPFAPGAVKLILIGPHILHAREESAAEFNITDPDNQFLVGGDPMRDKLHIPYTADPTEYVQFLANRLRWKSYMNTSGTVGCGFVEPLHIVVPELASERKQLKEAREKMERLKAERDKHEIDIDTSLSITTTQLQNPYIIRNTSRLARSKVEQTPSVPQQVLLLGHLISQLGDKINIRVVLSHDARKTLQDSECVIKVYQDGEEGSRIEATSQQFACSGKLVTALGKNYTIEGDTKIYDIRLQLFFLDGGAYRITVECLKNGTEQKLAPPICAKIVAK
jgi:hypothetical protein